MSTKRQIDFFVDQFGLPLVVGSFYGVKIGDINTTRATLYKCVMILRGKVWLRPIGPKPGPDSILSNLEAARVRFLALDANLSPLDAIPPGADIENRIEKMRTFLEKRLQICKKIQLRQAALIHDVFEALEGSQADDDLNDAVCSFVRDPESHSTIETLLEAYAASLRGDQ